MHYELDEEFYMRLKHNFNLYLLLTSKRINWKEDDVLHSIYRLNGYKCHKTVRYGMNSSHIHVKFEEENFAKEAVEYLNNMDADLTAILVDDMLRDWFNYEMNSGYSPPWTLTIVDIIGSPPLSLNFLTENILNSIFQNFGEPYLLPYTAAINEPHVQILFGSMTEALAACMAFGEWLTLDKKTDSFFYRVRINPSDKEASLIKNSGGTPKEAFKLDYFLNMRNEIVHHQKLSEPDTKQSKVSRNKVYSSHSKGTHKSRKNKYISAVNTEHKHSNLVSQVGNRTPILCVPVIAPLNSYAEAFMTTSSRLNADFASAILNIQQTCAISAQAIVGTGDSEVEYRPIQYTSAEETQSCSSSVEQSAISFLKEPSTDVVQSSVPEKRVSYLAKQTNVTTKHKKNFHKGTTRVFERRK